MQVLQGLAGCSLQSICAPLVSTDPHHHPPHTHTYSPAQRISPTEALKHPFLTQEPTDPSSTLGSVAMATAGPSIDTGSGVKAPADAALKPTQQLHSQAPKSPRVAATTATAAMAAHHYHPHSGHGGVYGGSGADAGTQT